jgi:alpha-galactosidase
MTRHLSWAPAAKSVLVSDPAVQPGLRAGGQALRFALDPSASRVRRMTDAAFGPGTEHLAAGDARNGALAVRREVRVFLPDAQPDVALSRSRYRNLGRAPLHLDAIDGERVLLDRAAAEPGAATHDFASYQGAAYAWGKDYTVMRLQPGFAQRNFMGQDDDAHGPEGVGGGMPFVDLWSPTMGVALAVVEPGPRWLSLPVTVRPDGRVEAGVREQPEARLGQTESLAPGETYDTVTTALVFHHGDYFAPLSTYGDLLRARGVAIPRESPASAHAPYWKSWGFRKDVTVAKFLGRLPELRALGITTANLDDGWYDVLGDWQPNRAPGKFPAGAADLIAFVAKVKAAGFRTALWWYPLGAAPDSALVRTRPDLFVMDEAGHLTRDVDGHHQLCPAHAPARDHIRATLRRFVRDWGFDGVYLDFQGLSAVPACFNPAHDHTPLAGFEAVPQVFRDIDEELHRLRRDPFLEACVCALPHAPFAMPFYAFASASDPRSEMQARQRIKAEKAIRGPRFAVGDGYQVPADEWRGTSLKEGFASALGTGAVLTTFYADLDAGQRATFQRWFHLASTLGPGTYRNLYDLAFDAPEAHVVARGDDLYYGFFAPHWTARLTLRGLDPRRRYEVFDYERGVALPPIDGAAPSIRVDFSDHLLLRVRPLPP